MNSIIKIIKKFSAFIIAFTLLASQLTACGNTAQTETAETEETEAVSIEASTETAEATETEEAETVETDTEETEDTSDVASMTSATMIYEEGDYKDPADDITEEPEQESAGVEIVEELDLTMYATANCNARTGDGTNYEAVALLEINVPVHVTGRTANGWYRVEWFGSNNEEVYVLGSLLSLTSPYEETTAAETSSATSTEASSTTNTDTSTSTETSSTTSTEASTETSTTSESSSSSSSSSSTTSKGDLAGIPEYDEIYAEIAAEYPDFTEEQLIKFATQEYYYETGHEGAKW